MARSRSVRSGHGTRRKGRRAARRTGASRLQVRAKRLYETGRMAEVLSVLVPLLRQQSPPVDALLLAAGAHLRLGEPEQALREVERAVIIHPDNLSTQLAHAEVLSALERYQEALDLLLALHQRHGNAPRIMTAIGKLCRQGGRPEVGLQYLRGALADNPDDTELLAVLGNILSDLGHDDTARRCYEQALAHDPNSAAANLGLATILRSHGHLAKAARIAHHGALKNPASGPLTFLDAQLTPPRTVDDQRIERLQQLLTRGGLGSQNTSLLHFTLAELYHRLGDHARAMDHYREGNRWRSLYLGRDFSLEQTRRRFNVYQELFTPRFFAERADWGVPTQLPVFIVGMPRSGTTLIESILGHHPAIHAAGELRLIGNVERELLGPNLLIDPTESIRTLTSAKIQAAATACLARYQRLAAGKARIVDKMPHNFEKLWLIALLFPRARVIHARRSPLDTCLSCYCTPFSEPHGYRNDLATLGRYYRAYRDLMAHWQKVLPLRFLEVQYEELTAHQEQQSHRLIRWCGLEWDDRCLAFQTGGVVKTASASQVRRGMYRSSVGRWRPYRRWLEPLREGLGPDLVAESERLAPPSPGDERHSPFNPQETLPRGCGSPI